MSHKRPDGQETHNGFSPRRKLEGRVDVRRQAMLAGAWRVADLLQMNHHSPAMLQVLHQIHLASREVIGGNLSRRALDRDGLERLQASVRRQLNETQDLQRKLAAVRASGALQEELADLLSFFEGALGQIARKLGSGLQT
jgi:acyl-[acyl carrier protein]--UDP-N-acetylglucosamine O-acyltransferase